MNPTKAEKAHLENIYAFGSEIGVRFSAKGEA